jgi:SAM-dependent methyltransferase
VVTVSGHAEAVPHNYFDERIAKEYDARWAELFEPAVVAPAVDFLAGLAAAGRALELGIGTGRIALPLSRHGIRVHGIELSPDMVAQLQAKPGADAIELTIGDFATTRAGDGFSLAYLVRNTITNLTTQDAQVECFRNVAAQLEPGGCFVIEVYVPELQRLPPGRDLPRLRRHTRTPRLRGVRHRHPDRDLTPLLGRRRPARDLLRTVPLRLAERARPDGTTGRHDAARTLEHLESRPVHQRKQEPRLGLAETVETQPRGWNGAVVARSAAGRGRSCRSDQEPSLTIRSVVGIQPVTNG